MYEIEYNGRIFDESTEIKAMAAAKHAIQQDAGPVEQWAVQHDDIINVWFVQRLMGGSPVGPTATITGPQRTTGEPQSSLPAHFLATSRRPRYLADQVDERWIRCAMFVGESPTDVFAQILAWIARQEHEIKICEVGWTGDTRTAASCQLMLYFQ